MRYKLNGITALGVIFLVIMIFFFFEYEEPIKYIPAIFGIFLSIFIIFMSLEKSENKDKNFSSDIKHIDDAFYKYKRGKLYD